MKFLEIIQELLLGLSITIILPVIVYWGVETYYSNYPNDNNVIVTQSYDLNVDSQSTDSDKNQKITKIRQVSFWPYFIVAVLSIVIGSFIKINSLCIGLIGGGVLTLLMSLAHTQNTPTINFCVFLFLFIALILVTIFRKK